MKKYLFPVALATALITTGCSESDFLDNMMPDSEKERISFSLSDAASSRSGFCGGRTFMAMRIQSNKKTGGSGVDKKYTRTVAAGKKDVSGTDASWSDVVFEGDNVRYWDDAHGRYSLLSVYAVAIPNSEDDIKNLATELPAAVTSGTSKWGTEGENKISWQITTSAQTKDGAYDSENNAVVSSTSGTIDQEDLVYSNNIQKDHNFGIYRYDFSSGAYTPSPTGIADSHHNGQMLFFQNGMTDETALTIGVTDAPGKFDKGHLIFNHALTRITIQLVKGEGFVGESSFQFTAENELPTTNITLHDMFFKGTLNLETGEWEHVNPAEDKADITKIAGSESAAAGFYVAQVLPGYEINSGETNVNVFKFTIDNNTYYITQDRLYQALYGTDDTNRKSEFGFDAMHNKYVLQQGKNYFFKITVDKKKIADMTATLEPWVKVTAKDFNLDNSHISFNFRGTSNGTECTDINLYQKTEDLTKIYTTNQYIADGRGKDFSGNYLVKDGQKFNTAGPHTTEWFFEDNKTAYHLRTVSSNAVASNDGNLQGNPTSFTMKDGNTMPDYHWGAPMYASLDGKVVPYDAETKGYAESIHPGIIATSSPINITEMHMLSNIYICLETSTDNSKVDLSNAKIKITKLSRKATVDMGTGYIAPEQTYSDISLAAPSTYWVTENQKTGDFQCAVIPQSLVRGSGDDDYVGITIKTKDNNQYFIIRKLSEIYATATTQNDAPVTDPNQPTASDSSTDEQKENARIKRWYPNHSYYYTIKITKKGIDAITATLSEWVKVIASDTNVDLES